MSQPQLQKQHQVEDKVENNAENKVENKAENKVENKAENKVENKAEKREREDRHVTAQRQAELDACRLILKDCISPTGKGLWLGLGLGSGITKTAKTNP